LRSTSTRGWSDPDPTNVAIVLSRASDEAP
jgi:hypothetical protein